MKYRPTKALGDVPGAQAELIRRLRRTHLAEMERKLGLRQPLPLRKRFRRWLANAFDL